ncbi:MAG: cytochrome C [Ignavibacteriae bacterium]|nr:cytochrome C [Ignavibacteriota bacterium]
MKIKLPPTIQNWVSLVGATIALISFSMIVFLFVVATYLNQSTSYLGLIIYILLPSVLIIGLILIPIGMILKRRRNKKNLVSITVGWPKIDLNDLKHRNAFFIFAIGTSIFLFASAIGSYQVFHFTESTTFCGEICHSVMEPEFVAYQNSPHAKVACVQCHVGTGADWYVRSKLSGLYQVYAVLTDDFSRPISTPIENLRPARETCEKCHWPQKFYSHKLVNERYYLPDENNSEWNINLIMKIGAEHGSLGLEEGIHWHINPNTKVEYISTDNKAEVIPWVKYTNKETGEVSVYVSEENPIDKLKLDSLDVHEMDCMDCHNRPSHNYYSPSKFIDDALTSGKIPKDLPEIKMISTDICSEEFSSLDSAINTIDYTIREFYNENYPDLDSNLIITAIDGITKEYQKNIFPEMKVRWDVYSDNIGHLEFNGCFRCHDDNHVSESGKTISKDCNLCHTIIGQGSPENFEVTTLDKTLEFLHPEDLDEDEWKDELCIECHAD